MKNILSPLAKFFAVVFAILFVVTLVLTLFIYSLEQHAFNAETYKDALYEEGVYERLPAIIGDQLIVSMGVDRCVQNPVSCDLEYRSDAMEGCLVEALGSESYQTLSNNERPPTDAENERIAPCFEEHGYPKTGEENEENPLASLSKNMTAKDWENFIIALIPPEDIKNISEETIDEIFEYLNGNTNAAIIPLGKFKERLTSDDGTDAIMALIKAQPDCSATDLLKLSGFSGEQEMVFCNPPEITTPVLRAAVASQLNAFVNEIPDKKILLAKSTNKESLFETQSLRILMRLSPILPITLLFFITLLVVRTLQTWLRWWGIPLFIAGVIALIFSLMTGPLLQILFSMPLIQGISMEVSGSVIQLIYDLFTTIIHRLVENIALYALITTTLGLGMTIGSIFAKRADKSKEII